MDHNTYESHLKANSMKLHILKPEVRQKSEIHTVEDLIKAKNKQQYLCNDSEKKNSMFVLHSPKKTT